MYIVYLTVMLVNMAAAFALVALFLLTGPDNPNRQRWVPALTVSGLVALAFGLHMSFVWPMPGVYNMAFGELSVLLGAILLGGAWAVNRNLDLMPISVYAFFTGIASIFVGTSFIVLKVSQEPVLTGLGLIASGAAGVLSLPMAYLYPRSPGLSRAIQLIIALILLVMAGVWAYTGFTGYADHMDSFRQWNPNQ